MIDQERDSILCVIDLTEPSIYALQWSIQVALRQGYRISVLYPYRLNVLDQKPEVMRSKKEMDMAAAESFRQMAENILRKDEVSFDFRAEVGFLRDRIQEYLKRSPTAMVVMSRQLAVSNPESVQELISELKIPTIIVPATQSR